MSTPAISLICSTIGRPQELDRLLQSIRASSNPAEIEFILVDQSQDQACARVLRDVTMPGPVRATTTERGISVGRNAGVRLATADVVTFPNDNCWYPPDAINAAIAYLEANPGIAGLSAKLVTPAGRRAVIRWGRRPTGISRSNFYRTSTGSALFLRREIFDKTGYFDESMGTGSPGRIGAGEDADLILRVVAAGHRLSYCPEILIFVDQGHGIVRDDGKVSPENVTKLAKYGVAMGYLWRRHRLASGRLLYICARKSVKSALLAVRGHRILAQAELAYIRGAIAGWRSVEQ